MDVGESKVSHWLLELSIELDADVHGKCSSELWLAVEEKLTPSRRSMQQFYRTTYKLPVDKLDLVPIHALGTFRWTELECSTLPETVLGLSAELAEAIAGQLNRGMSDSVKKEIRQYAKD